MLGRTAQGLYWMNRYIERAENMARLVDTGLRMALTSTAGNDEWASVLRSAAAEMAYLTRHGSYEEDRVIDFLLRDPENPSSVMATIEKARNNGRMVRTGLTRETWEALNEAWMGIKSGFRRPIERRNLPTILNAIKRETSLIRGAFFNTQLRNEIFDFCQLGTYVERADNTSRILDVKYYVLLPSVSWVGSSLDNYQWESILRSVSAHRSYRWMYEAQYRPQNIADFLILNRRMPRSLAFCVRQIDEALTNRARDYGERHGCHETLDRMKQSLEARSIRDVFDVGLHEFLSAFIAENNALGAGIADAYRFD